MTLFKRHVGRRVAALPPRFEISIGEGGDIPPDEHSACRRSSSSLHDCRPATITRPPRFGASRCSFIRSRMILRLSGPRSTTSPIWTSVALPPVQRPLASASPAARGDCPPSVVITMKIADRDDPLRRRLGTAALGRSTAANTSKCQIQSLSIGTPRRAVARRGTAAAALSSNALPRQALRPVRKERSHAYCCLIARFPLILLGAQPRRRRRRPSSTSSWPTSSSRRRPSSSIMAEPMCCGLHNVADGGHDFTAPAFFAAAAVAPEDRRWVTEGEVEVPPGQVREIRLTAPAAGSYKLKCTHSFHKMLRHERARSSSADAVQLDFPAAALIEDAPVASLGTGTRPRQSVGLRPGLISSLDGDKEFKNGSPCVPVVRLALPAPLDPSPGHLGDVGVSRGSNRLPDGPARGTFRSMAWIVRKKPIWLPS